MALFAAFLLARDLIAHGGAPAEAACCPVF